MEDLMFLLSLEDFFALLALFVGCFTSIFCMRRSVSPRKPAIQWQLHDSYQPSINPGLVETYPMAARQPLRTRLLRRVQHTDGEADTYDRLIFG